MHAAAQVAAGTTMKPQDKPTRPAESKRSVNAGCDRSVDTGVAGYEVAGYGGAGEGKRGDSDGKHGGGSAGGQLGG